MKNLDFDKYMEDFKLKPLREKQKITFDQLKMLASITNGMCINLGIDNKIIINKELYDLSKEDFTNDDYVEAMLVLINSVQNSLFDFTDKIDALLKKVDEKEN